MTKRFPAYALFSWVKRKGLRSPGLVLGWRALRGAPRYATLRETRSTRGRFRGLTQHPRLEKPRLENALLGEEDRPQCFPRIAHLEGEMGLLQTVLPFKLAATD